MDAINTIIPSIIKSSIRELPHVAGVIDLASAVDPAHTQQSADTCDGIHMSTKGDKKIVAALLAHLSSYIALFESALQLQVPSDKG